MSKQTELDPRAAYQAAADKVQDLCGELTAAIGELRAASLAVPIVPHPPGPGFASRIAAVIDATLAAWRRAEPDAFGMPRNPTPREEAIREAKRDVELFRRRLTWAREAAAHASMPQAAGKQLVQQWEDAVANAESRLTFYETGSWPGPKPPTNEQAFNLPAAVRESLGLPVRKTAPMPDFPR